MLAKVTSGGKDKKNKADMGLDIGIMHIDNIIGGTGAGQQNHSTGGNALAERSTEDSFERYYNKDLDLDEGSILPFLTFVYRSSAHSDIRAE